MPRSSSAATSSIAGPSRLRSESGSAERELLLLLSRRSLTPQDTLGIQRLLHSPLDWDYTLSQSWGQEVYPLVYDNLRKFGFDHVPQQAQEQLTSWYKLNAFRNQHMVEELCSLLTALDSAGIPAIPLKGVALAQSLYGDISLRLSRDLDILVPPHLAKSGLHVLTDMGYTQHLPGFEREALRIYIESSLTRNTPVGEWLVELHWAVLWNSKTDKRALEDLWRESSRHVFFGAKGLRMSPEWEFLLLAIHAARSSWQGIKWLADIHDMCSLRKIDWPRVLQKAEIFGWTNLVQVTVTACNTLFGTPAPPELFRGGRPPWLKLFPSSHNEISRGLLPLYWLEGNSAKLRYAARALFVQTPAEWNCIYLPRCARFLYTPLRLARLAAKWTPRTIRLATSRQEQRS